MTDDMKASIKERAAEWLFHQGVSTVLLVGILASLGVGAYRIPSLIESHDNRIRQTFDSLESSHREERDSRWKALAEDRKADRELLREVMQTIKRANGE